jgi:thiol-disulfide isomerase/thioredoxin
MNRFFLLIFALTFSSILFSQSFIENRCLYKAIRETDGRIITQADDFTITTTDGITRNLYSTLNSGKTVFIDLFYTTCEWCQIYAPVIEEIYQNTGAGQSDIEFWGISNNLFDPDSVIDQYKIEFDVSNPCAGPQGGGTTAFSTIVNGQNFIGFPSYCVICPDRTLIFNPCYPPTVTGFDPYFAQCAAIIGTDDNFPKSGGTRIISVYPNPASTGLSLEVIINIDDPVAIELFNLLGVKVFSSSYEVYPGIQTISISASQFPGGTYFIRLMQNGQFIDTQKVWIN